MRFLLPLLTLCASLSPEMQTAVNHISENSLRGNLSYLSSDLLEGRATPSRGLDLAADYIAAQYRRAGLEPVGDDGYFQTATLTVREPNWDGFRMSVTVGGKTTDVDKKEVYLLPDSTLSLNNVPIVAIDARTKISSELVDGKVVFLSDPRAFRVLQGYQPLVIFAEARNLPAGPHVRDPEASAGGPRASLIAKSELTEL